MKTAFCCLNANLRAASFVLLYFHLLVFGWVMLETLMLTMPIFLFWIMLVLVSIFSAAIVSVHMKKYTGFTLTMAFSILFLIALILIIYTSLANVLVALVVEVTNIAKPALEEAAKNPRKYSFNRVQNYEDQTAQMEQMDQFRNGLKQLLQYLEDTNIRIFIFDIIVFFVIAFYVYSASVLKRYKGELKLQSQPPVSASYVVMPQTASYPRAADMSHVEFGFGTHRHRQH